MKASLRRWSSFALLACLGAGGLRAATPVIGAQLFQDTNSRIDDLFRIRTNPPKPPGPEDNPFRAVDEKALLPPANTDHPGGSTTPVVPETPDQTLLRLAYANLNFGGLLMVGDRLTVVINKASYKEGGLLTVRVQGATEYLRIISLTTDSITLGLRDARLTLNF